METPGRVVRKSWSETFEVFELIRSEDGGTEELCRDRRDRSPACVTGCSHLTVCVRNGTLPRLALTATVGREPNWS